MSPRKLIAARDPHGFRPLCIGLLDGDCYVFASETCALDALGAKFIRDVEPGEVCVVENGELRSMHCDIECKTSACVFDIFISPVRTPSSTARRSSLPVRRPASICPLSIRSARTSLSACRTPVSRRPSATRSSRASRTASASSKTAISPVLLFSRVRTSASARCASS